MKTFTDELIRIHTTFPKTFFQIINFYSTSKHSLFITFQILREADPSYQDLLIVNNFMFDRCLVQHETGSNQFHLEDFLSIVTRMSVFFASKIDWDDIGIDTSGLDNNGLQLDAITIGYSEEEEEWYVFSFSKYSCFC